jgi:hypothetical protein
MGYNVNGFGNGLLGASDFGADPDTASAYENLFQNDHTGWDVGLQGAQVLGRRLSKTRLNNTTLQLNRLTTIARDMSRDIDIEVLHSYQEIELARDMEDVVVQRINANQIRIEALESRLDGAWDSSIIDRLAEAHVSLAHAHAQRHAARLRKQQAEIEFAYRCGTILDDVNVSIR